VQNVITFADMRHRSYEWKGLNDEQKKFIGQADKEDGEFWLAY